MFAPAAAEDITFPQQSYLDWSQYEANQWCRAANAYFTTNNTAVYSAPQAQTSMGRTINHGVLAENGKIYLGADAASTTLTVLNTYTDARSTITSTGNLATYSAFYSAFTKKVYFPGNGALKVFNTLNDTYETSITYSSPQTFAWIFGTSYDGRYAYLSGWTTNHQIMKLDLMNNTMSNTAVTTYTGDPQNGTMGINGKLYWGCGGGSTAGIHCFNPFTVSMEYVTVPGQANVSDYYRDVVQHPDGYLYCFPAYGASTIVRIDPRTNTSIIAKTGVTDTRANNYALGADGKIYVVGNGTTTRMLNYNPVDNSVAYETLPSGDWQTIIMGPNGDLHMFATSGLYYKKVLSNNGGTLRPLQEFNGIVSRLTGA
jgi:hypothetical protein